MVVGKLRQADRRTDNIVMCAIIKSSAPATGHLGYGLRISTTVIPASVAAASVCSFMKTVEQLGHHLIIHCEQTNSKDTTYLNFPIGFGVF